MNAVMMILQSVVLPRVQKQAAVYIANFLNRRHRRRLGLPEAESEAHPCPPCPTPEARSDSGGMMKTVFSVLGSVAAGALLGAAVGALVARK